MANNSTVKGTPIRLLTRQSDHSIAEQDPAYHGITPLHQAAFNNAPKKVSELLQSIANATIADDLGWTPLHDASIQGNLEIVKLLLAASADVNAQDREDHYTPLHDAVRMNHVEVVKALLDAGADTSLTDRWGNTPLDIAKEHQLKEMISLVR